MSSVMVRFGKEFKQVIVAPVLVVGMAALILYLLGTLPAHLPGAAAAVKEYDSIEEAATELGFEIVTPVYFPSYLSWPADKVRGQRQPFPMVEIIFRSSDRTAEILSITEIVSDSLDLPVPLPWVEAIYQEMPVDVNGNQGRLIVGKRSDAKMVNAVYWTAKGRYVVVVTTESVKELLTLARSMYP